MTGEQIEMSFVATAFVFVTLVGYGVIRYGDDSEKSLRAKRTFRTVGPVGLISMLAWLAMSFIR